jgi:thiol-disulfide isomerase/thioredoxin
MRTLLLTAVLVSSCPAAFAQEPAAPAAKAPAAMTIGSPAPTPEVSDFIRGEQPKWFEKGKTYVVEFWATWCGPCRASMPHLSDLADRYKDSVVVVGISDEQPDVVRGFLDKDEWKKKARYNLAADPDRSVHRDYMEAAGKNGIPTAFIVRDGKVQWIGHPMQMDEPLAKVVDGTWDAKAAKKEFDDAAATARKQQERRRAIGEARKAGDWKKIIAMMDEDIAGATGSQKRQAQMSKFRTMIGAAKMPKEGYSFGRELVAASKGDAEALNEIAWYVLDDKAVGVRDIPFALETAKAAIAAAGAPEPAIMDTLARAYWESGDKAKALEWQEKAVKAAGDDEDVAGQMKETLERYRNGEAPAPPAGSKKTSFRDDAPSPGAADGAPAPAPAPSPRRAPRPAVKLGGAAEKVFPAVSPEGFESTDAIIAFLPDAGKDEKGLLRVVRAMHSSTDEGKTSLRVASALIEDMTPLASAMIAKFGKTAGAPIQMPAPGESFEIKPEGDNAALLISKDASGATIGQPRALVKVDGKWWFDFDKGAAARPGEGAQMAMMANMLGEGLRTAIRTAAADTAKRVVDGEIKSGEEAQTMFNQAVQQQMMTLMGAPGTGGPGGPGAPMPGRPAGGQPAPAPTGAPAAALLAAPAPPAKP